MFFLMGRIFITWKNSQKKKEKENKIVLYCIMMPYTEGRLDRYHIGIP